MQHTRENRNLDNHKLGGGREKAKLTSVICRSLAPRLGDFINASATNSKLPAANTAWPEAKPQQTRGKATNSSAAHLRPQTHGSSHSQTRSYTAMAWRSSIRFAFLRARLAIVLGLAILIPIPGDSIVTVTDCTAQSGSISVWVALAIFPSHFYPAACNLATNP